MINKSIWELSCKEAIEVELPHLLWTIESLERQKLSSGNLRDIYKVLSAAVSRRLEVADE
jgi:hypothetical protein